MQWGKQKVKTRKKERKYVWGSVRMQTPLTETKKMQSEGKKKEKWDKNEEEGTGEDYVNVYICR